jgi:hypothetical protein
MLRKANAHWQGSIKEGSGPLSTQSGAMSVARALLPSITITLDAALVP